MACQYKTLMFLQFQKAQLLHKEMWWNSSLLTHHGSNLISDVHSYFILLFIQYWICSPTEQVGWRSYRFDWYSGVSGWVSATNCFNWGFHSFPQSSRQLLEADPFHILSDSLLTSQLDSWWYVVRIASLNK